jgi:hypothetical protein
MAKPLPRKTSRHGKTFWVAVALLGLIIAGIAVAAVWHYENEKAIAADRARFEQADKDVKAVAASIRSALPPEKENLIEECTHQSREFQTEPIVCSVKQKLFYGANQISDINQLVKDIDGVLMSHSRQFEYKGMGQKPIGFTSSNQLSFMSTPASSSADVLSQLYTDKTSGLTCPLSYEIYNSATPPITSNYSVSAKPLSIMLTFLCSGSVRSAVYPINDSL